MVYKAAIFVQIHDSNFSVTLCKRSTTIPLTVTSANQKYYLKEKKEMTNTNTNTNTVVNANEEVTLESIQALVLEYTKLRKFTEGDNEYTLEDVARVSELNSEIENAVESYNKKLREEWYAHLAESENPIKQALVEYELKVLAVKDAFSKSKMFESRELISRVETLSLFGFEKYLDVDSEIVKTQRANLSKFKNAFDLRVATALGGKKYADDVESAMKGDSKTMMSIDEYNVAEKSLVSSMQRLVDSIYYEESKNGNAIVCDKYDVAYLKEAYTKKARTTGTIALSKENAIAKIICDMIHIALTGGSYSVVGYREEKKNA